MYIGYFRPKQERKMNRLELFNEFFFQMFCYHGFCFTDWVDKDTQYLLGQSFITCTVFLVLTDLLFLASDFYEPLRVWMNKRRLYNAL